MSGEAGTTGRAPGAITAVCAVWLLASGLETWMFLTRAAADAATTAYFLVLQVVAAVAVILIWRLRRPGLWLFAGVFALTQGVMAFQGRWSIDALWLPLLVLVVAGAHLNRMR